MDTKREIIDNCNMKILILGALDKEICVLNDLIHTELKDGFYTAKINNNEIYTATTGVGILNASVVTYNLINKIHPDIVINIGTAGGHTLNVKDGDIIICDEAIYHGGYVIDNPTLSSCDCMEDTILKLNGNEKLSKLLNTIKTNDNIYHGKTLSGDFFTKDKEIIKKLQNKYHHHCEDMETIAVYKVCEKEKIPAIAVRIISNNELLDTKYEDNVLKVNKTLQNIIYQFLNHLN